MGPQPVVAGGVVEPDVDPHRPLAGPQLQRGADLVPTRAPTRRARPSSGGPAVAGRHRHPGPQPGPAPPRSPPPGRAGRRACRRWAGTSCRCRRSRRRRPAGRARRGRRARTCRRGVDPTVTSPLASTGRSSALDGHRCDPAGVAGRPRRPAEARRRRPPAPAPVTGSGLAHHQAQGALGSGRRASSAAARPRRSPALRCPAARWRPAPCRPRPRPRTAVMVGPSTSSRGGHHDARAARACSTARAGLGPRAPGRPRGASVPGHDAARRPRSGAGPVGLTTTGPSWRPGRPARPRPGSARPVGDVGGLARSGAARRRTRRRSSRRTPSRGPSCG